MANAIHVKDEDTGRETTVVVNNIERVVLGADPAEVHFISGKKIEVPLDRANDIVDALQGHI